MKRNIAIMASWHIEKNEDGVMFLPYTHFIYLSFAAEKFNQVFLIAPIVIKTEISSGFYRINMPNIKVVELPDFNSFLSAQKLIFKFVKSIKLITDKVDLFYCRVPDPFSWLPAFITGKPVIMHFVGDTIDATRYNEKWSWLKKWFMISGYFPDYLLTIKAAKSCRVYTNGNHLASKLRRYGVKPVPVISSTVKFNELTGVFHNLQNTPVRLTYIGYLRYAKGLLTILKTIQILEQKRLPFVFNIVGDGEMYNDVADFIQVNKLEGKVELYGHVDDRNQLNFILNKTDLFFFPSLSEGSPRVVIEAMGQGVPVISTPVGSCPDVFQDRIDIRFFDFNNAEQAVTIIEEYLCDNTSFQKQREKAYENVKLNYSLESFLNKVFDYEA